MTTLTADLGKFLATIQFDDLPADALSLVRDGFTDTVGVMMVGIDEPVVDIARRTLLQPGSWREARACLSSTYVWAPDAALIGGIVGGTLWHLNNLFGFLYVSRVVTNSAIYGKLALLPVFMAGLYFSWLILLFGAQVSYAFQNRKLYLQEKLVENVNQRGREFIALRLMTLIGGCFQRGEPPVTIQEISAGLGIPTKLAQQVLRSLLAARLVIEVAGAETAYAPARPLDDINAHHILRAIRAGGGQEAVTRDEPSRAEVLGEFAKIEEAERAAASSVTLLTLVNRAQKQIGDAAAKAK